MPTNETFSIKVVCRNCNTKKDLPIRKGNMFVAFDSYDSVVSYSCPFDQLVLRHGSVSRDQPPTNRTIHVCENCDTPTLQRAQLKE